MDKKNDKELISMRIDIDLKEKIKFIAQKEERNFTTQICYIAKIFVEQYERKHGEIVLTND